MRPRRDSRVRLIWLAAAAAVLGLVVALIGGYAFGWPWTGFREHRTLWDLLHLLVLPVVVGAVPIWYRTRSTAGPLWAAAIAVFGALLIVVLVGGYVLGWSWTGFEGATLWDWLELLVLPLALAGLPVWLQARASLGRNHKVALAAALALFATVVVGGYVLAWDWTGFKDNTLWDWLGLLLVPFVLPAAITWYLATADPQQGRTQPSSSG